MNHKCSFGIWATTAFGKVSHVTVSCRQWKCKHCRKQLIAGWCAHFSDCTERLPTLYRHTVERRDWPRIYKQLQRRGIRYIAVSLGYTRMAVYADIQHGDSLPISQKDAAETFQRELNGYIHQQHKHPVSTCREWKQPKRESKMTRIPDVKPVKAAVVRTAAEQMGITLKPWTSADASGLEVLAQREDAMNLITFSESLARTSRCPQSSMPEKGLNRAVRTPTRAMSPNRRTVVGVAAVFEGGG